MSQANEQPADSRQVTDIDSLIEAFRSMSSEEIAARGFTVEGTFDQVDDPILLGPDGLPVNTWQESYPYTERMSRSEYESLKRDLQVELLKAQDWIKSTGQKLVLVFEGRDAAGKGGAIKRIVEPLDPRHYRVVAFAKPTFEETPRVAEIHVLDWAGTLDDYGWRLEATLVRRLRGQYRYDDLPSLLAQIDRDIAAVRRTCIESGHA